MLSPLLHDLWSDKEAIMHLAISQHVFLLLPRLMWQNTISSFDIEDCFKSKSCCNALRVLQTRTRSQTSQTRMSLCSVSLDLIIGTTQCASTCGCFERLSLAWFQGICEPSLSSTQVLTSNVLWLSTLMLKQYFALHHPSSVIQAQVKKVANCRQL